MPVHHLQPPTKKQTADTGILLALVATIAGLYTDRSLYFIMAAALLFMLLVYPALFRLPAMLWFGLARLLSTIMSKVFLSVIFYLLVVPVGLLRKLGRHDRLRLRRFDRGSPTWHNRNHLFKPDDLNHIF